MEVKTNPSTLNQDIDDIDREIMKLALIEV